MMEMNFQTISIVLVGLLVIAILSVLFCKVISINDEFSRNSKWVLIAILFSWLLFSLWYSINIGAGRIIFLFVISPIIISSILSFFYPLKQMLRKMPAHWLVFLQLYRIEGFIFLYVYFSQGQLSKGFAFNAGFGDILTGLLALPVGWIVMKKIKNYRKAAVLWNIFGIADLIVAPAAAIYFGANGLGSFPLLLVPMFLGPPLGITLHILSLRQIDLVKRSLNHFLEESNLVHDPHQTLCYRKEI